jgi:lipoyl(octanoyl) transferase
VCTGLGVDCGRVDGRSGVWLAADGHRIERKIAAIGVRVQRGVTQHGFALNCNPDMTEWTRIIPCGITDAGVTSLTAELGRPVRVADVIDDVAAAVADALDGRLPLREHGLTRPVAVAPAP